MSRPVQFLRPCIHSSVRLKSVNALACCLPPLLCKTIKKRGISGAEVGDTARSSAKLLASNDPYPRYVSANNTASCQELLQHFKCLKNDEFANNDDVTIHGRIQTIRTAGLKLFFLDVNQDGYIVQGVLDFSNLQADEISFKNFDEASRTLKRGDIITLSGKPHRTKRGQLSLLASKLPKLLSPCLHTLPTEITNKETRIRNRHVDLLINSQTKEIIQLRSNVIFYIRRFLIDDDYIEVQTPIIADAAGGAIARPFQTRSVEFVGRRLSLRTAPELWLKRLVIGGFEKIFEIGPCFRNEGLDLNHNPEFTSCEFYRAFANLEDLIHMTEEMLSGLAAYIATRLESRRHQIELLGIDFSVPFKRLDFIPAIESAIQYKLPDLSSPNAEFELLKLFENLTITPPTLPNLPHLLDRLSSIYLEPQCSTPTFIIHHPECISPLSKSFTHPTTHQQVAARAELFINKQEIANTYEEENSPVEQRRKFVSQLRYREEGDPSSIDEDYLQALEWGLPPTGGWGCGIDRLCMLMTGTSRIGDVLPFGTLRNVVALGRSPNTDLLSKTAS